MRLVAFFVLLLALALVGYLVIAGYFLAHATTGLLRLGPVAAIIATATPPEDPLALGYRGNPMQALSLPFEVVQIETPLGPAEAWLVPAAGPEAGRAIFVHGIAGAREDGYRHLAILHEAGWSVLLMTYRNDPTAPESPEGQYAFGLLEWPDLQAAVAYMSPGPDGPGLLVVAESMGAAVLGQFLARSDLAGRVGAVALDSPAISFSAVVGQLAALGGRPLPGPMSWIALQLVPPLSGLPMAEAEVSEIFAAFPGPIFIAHGAGDRIVPIAPSQALAAARPDAVTLWTGADHLGSHAEDPVAFRAALAGFLADLGT
jgi:alpha/beta superfamily hydrolase